MSSIHDIHNWTQERERLFHEHFRAPQHILRSLEYAAQVSLLFDQVLRDAATTLVPTEHSDYCLCSFGSPARREMLGHSDLDCLILRSDRRDTSCLRQGLFDSLRAYGFPKLDIPEWGSLVDCERFLASAITEGNQIIEARWAAGSRVIFHKLKALRERYCTKARFQSTLLFQYHYFKQYYAQRHRAGRRNLKYGHGGTRDFLFPIWLSYLRDGVAQFDATEKPHILIALASLAEHGDVSAHFLRDASSAVALIAFLRDELLRHSEGTKDSGLTYLDAESSLAIAQRLPQLFTSGHEVLERGLQAVRVITRLKYACYKAFLRLDNIATRIKVAGPEDELAAISIAWSRDLRSLPHRTISRLLDGSRWSVLASLGCNPTCTDSILRHLVTLGLVPGFEYILKVVGRNPQASIETLQRIASSSVEWRFREPAATRMEQGWSRANEL